MDLINKFLVLNYKSDCIKVIDLERVCLCDLCMTDIKKDFVFYVPQLLYMTRCDINGNRENYNKYELIKMDYTSLETELRIGVNFVDIECLLDCLRNCYTLVSKGNIKYFYFLLDSIFNILAVCENVLDMKNLSFNSYFKSDVNMFTDVEIKYLFVKILDALNQFLYYYNNNDFDIIDRFLFENKTFVGSDITYELLGLVFQILDVVREERLRLNGNG